MCPVCGFRNGGSVDCPACGFVRGRDYQGGEDHVRTWELRHQWADGGCKWHGTAKPSPWGWSAVDGIFRLYAAGLLGPLEVRL
jgi:hypothetical protein